MEFTKGLFSSFAVIYFPFFSFFISDQIKQQTNAPVLSVLLMSTKELFPARRKVLEPECSKTLLNTLNHDLLRLR